MKPTVVYKLKKESKWLTASAVFMGLAFFLQALDFIGLRLMQGFDLVDWILYMIAPMLVEAVWCVYVRSNQEPSAKIGGIIGALMCLIVLTQTLFCGHVLLLVLGSISCLLAGATLVLVTWGFVAHRKLGLLVLTCVAAIRILLFDVISYVSNLNWNGILQELPVVCILLSLVLFFGGFYPTRKE